MSSADLYDGHNQSRPWVRACRRNLCLSGSPINRVWTAQDWFIAVLSVFCVWLIVQTACVFTILVVVIATCRDPCDDDPTESALSISLPVAVVLAFLILSRAGCGSCCCPEDELGQEGYDSEHLRVSASEGRETYRHLQLEILSPTSKFDEENGDNDRARANSA
eukprot:TRINITY_DN21234_c0_g1_i1.p1 TRINITY_DN21234_c0_g1~~TRINITY_DN21234_c0_g1_i1.p1  ORF type:complete len:164 (-),score=31.49 TRINITY_DN21234_c0_g1_i1:216-707(-)